jgi:hypothetical protein
MPAGDTRPGSNRIAREKTRNWQAEFNFPATTPAQSGCIFERPLTTRNPLISAGKTAGPLLLNKTHPKAVRNAIFNI